MYHMEGLRFHHKNNQEPPRNSWTGAPDGICGEEQSRQGLCLLQEQRNLYKNHVWTLLWSTSEEEEIAVKNVPGTLGRLGCYDSLLLGRDCERINFKLSHSRMSEDLYLILISKISLDRNQLGLNAFLFNKLIIHLTKICWKSTLSSSKYYRVANHTCKLVLPDDLLNTIPDLAQLRKSQEWKSHFRKQLERLSLGERKVGGGREQWDAQMGTWEYLNLGQKGRAPVQSQI